MAVVVSFLLGALVATFVLYWLDWFLAIRGRGRDQNPR